MNKKLLLCAGCMLLGLTACNDKMDPNDPTSVRKFIAKQQIAFTPNQFVSFAVNSDTAKMTLFLQASFEIDAAADNGNNAVAIAANKGNMMVLNYLFDHGAKANVRNSAGETVIDNAVTMGNKDIVSRLLEQLAKEGAEPANLSSAVLIATKLGKADILEMLANAGAPLEVKGPDGYYPIHWAVKSGNYDAMMFLIGKGVDLNVKCGQGYSVLDWAANEGYTRLIKELKKNKAKNTPAFCKEFRSKC
ncbi:MAG: ankyrin repeat domain-containing protein [Fibrobacteraceae bacterium]|nr:ankyrin repeat domain-containing protein [Fibrobacteraceae bacterium]